MTGGPGSGAGHLRFVDAAPRQTSGLNEGSYACTLANTFARIDGNKLVGSVVNVYLHAHVMESDHFLLVANYWGPFQVHSCRRCKHILSKRV